MVTGCKISIRDTLRSDIAVPLTDVFVRKLMRQADTLGLMLDRFAVHDGVLELLHNGFVDGVTLDPGQLVFLCVIYGTYEVLNCAGIRP